MYSEEPSMVSQSTIWHLPQPVIVNSLYIPFYPLHTYICIPWPDSGKFLLCIGRLRPRTGPLSAHLASSYSAMLSLTRCKSAVILSQRLCIITDIYSMEFYDAIVGPGHAMRLLNYEYSSKLVIIASRLSDASSIFSTRRRMTGASVTL